MTGRTDNPYESPCSGNNAERESIPSRRDTKFRRWMVRLARSAAWFAVVSIIAAEALCVWAVVGSRTPGVSGEILMVLPGMTCLALQAGCVLAVCTGVIWRKMARWERAIFCTLAVVGVVPLPTLLVLEFLDIAP